MLTVIINDNYMKAKGTGASGSQNTKCFFLF